MLPARLIRSVVPLTLLGLSSERVPSGEVAPGHVTPTAITSAARASHSDTASRDGRVLIAGGFTAAREARHTARSTVGRTRAYAAGADQAAARVVARHTTRDAGGECLRRRLRIHRTPQGECLTRRDVRHPARGFDRIARVEQLVRAMITTEFACRPSPRRVWRPALEWHSPAVLRARA